MIVSMATGPPHDLSLHAQVSPRLQAELPYPLNAARIQGHHTAAFRHGRLLPQSVNSFGYAFRLQLEVFFLCEKALGGSCERRAPIPLPSKLHGKNRSV